MTDREISLAWEEAKSRVTVLCNEHHQHTAEGGCLSGPLDAVNVCRLAEGILSERKALRGLAEAVGP
jgi:hypothetical protein